MYNYQNMPIQNSYQPNQMGGNRFAGGFLGPFILGGITGGLAAPLFYGPNYGGRPY